jgi:hypothetical protein
MTSKGGVELGSGEIHNLDRQIEVLMDCKPLAETEVKALCERVCAASLISGRQRKS